MNDAVTPFTIHVDDSVIADLQQRLGNTRWPEKEPVNDWSQGAPLAYVQELCRYWLESYDWRERERRLNRFPQFKTKIDGLDIHFIHVKSPVATATPLVMTRPSARTAAFAPPADGESSNRGTRPWSFRLRKAAICDSRARCRPAGEITAASAREGRR